MATIGRSVPLNNFQQRPSDLIISAKKKENNFENYLRINELLMTPITSF